MLQISNIKLPVDGDEALLRRRAAKILGVRPSNILELSLHRQSIDARKKKRRASGLHRPRHIRG